MGKTHLIFETMKTAIFGVYLCFRRFSDNLTYPPASPVLNWLIEPKNESLASNEDEEIIAMTRFLYIMQATEQLFVTWFHDWTRKQKQEPTPQDWIDHQKGEKFDFIHFQTALLKAAQEIAKNGREKKEETDHLDRDFVFFMDEGRTLVEHDIFRDVRRCFQKDSPAKLRHLKPFAVFTDTLSTLTNFAPTKRVDPSARGFAKGKGLLFPPFYFVNSLDIFIGRRSSETTPAEATLSEYGRPLWKTYEMHLKQKSCKNLGRDLLAFARKKLLRSTELLKDTAVGVHRKAAAIACLACRAAPLGIYPGRRLATELVGGHMAVCSHVYEDRETILIGYPSEPLLARASRSALRGWNKDFSGWKVSLDELQKAIEEADVDTGKIGELIHRMVLLLAIDMASAAAEDESVSLYDFLRAMVGRSIDNMIDDVTKRELEGKYVLFNHFLPVYYVPDASKFQEIANRCAATVCKPGQNGIDHEIPLMDKNYKVVGTLAVQTKCVASKHDSDYPASAGWKMSREFALHGSDRDGSHNSPKRNKVGDFYFALYHNIGYHLPDGKPSFECKSMEEARDAHEWTTGRKQCHAPKGLEIVGLDLPLFERLEEIRDKLKEMRDQGRNPIAHMKDSTDLRRKMQQLAPLAYSALRKRTKSELEDLLPPVHSINGTGFRGRVLKEDIVQWFVDNEFEGNELEENELEENEMEENELEENELEDNELEENETPHQSAVTKPNYLTSSLLGVGGLDDVVAELNEQVYLPLKAAPAAAARFGVAPPSGIMLHGPPGCGKSLLATRLATLLAPSREPHVVRGPEIMSKFWGEDEENVRELFEPPAYGLKVVVLDEADTLLKRRGAEGGPSGGHVDRIVAQFLSCMDGAAGHVQKNANNSCGRVLMIATTNLIEAIDPAVLRPGRFSLSLRFPQPCEEGRLDILKYETKGLRQAQPTALDTLAEEFLGVCARLTSGFSGADLAGIVRVAKMKALHRVIREKGEVVSECEDATMLSKDIYSALGEELKRRGNFRSFPDEYSKYS
mmetsp:Transcript_35960/g.74759  ORF Transcript_35960/g.74759 Transcript_35960/m.74759 type:complete len:1023 (-) Transcript_35960:613-3681(-)